MEEGTSNFRSELLFPPVLAAGLLILFGFGLYLVAEVIQDQQDLFRIAMFWVSLFPIAGLIWLASRFNERIGRWSALAAITGATAAVPLWLEIPGSTIFLLIPLVLAPALVNLRVTLALCIAETLFIFWMEKTAWQSTQAVPGSVLILAVWLVFLILLRRQNNLYRVTSWAWGYFWKANQLLEESRSQQVEYQQALNDLAYTNLQLARLNQLAQNMRQAADEARSMKEQFVSNVSHELRTPLNMIIGYSEMILKNPAAYRPRIPQSLMADLDVILRNAKHLSDLVDDVLDLSQVETGRVALYKERVALPDIIGAAVTAVRPLFESKKLTLQVDIQPNLPDLFCDPVRIREVLLNLLSNAGRFTEQGSVQLRACQQGEKIVVSVSDTGFGIKDDDINKLFKPFQQVDSSIRRQFGGTGLGLSISKSFIELHDGKIWVESQVGQGTTFFFTLPLVLPKASGEGFSRWLGNQWEGMAHMQPSHAPKPQLQPRLVVVEQGRTLHKVLARFYEGVEVVHAGCIEEALLEAEKGPVQMLVINSLDAMQEISRLDGCRIPEGVPVVICSVAKIVDDMDSLGVSGSLVKPISQEQLLDAVNHFSEPDSTILIVDDEAEALRLFRRMIAGDDNRRRVLVAQNGQEALEVLKSQGVDLILLDLVMPQMDGFQLLQMLQGNPAYAKIPVILISAKDPMGHPVVSSLMAITIAGGLSMQRLLDCFQALGRVFSSTAPPVDRAPVEATDG